MPTRLTEALRDATADAIVDAVDAGAAAGYLELYSGFQPADAEADILTPASVPTPGTSVLLATLTLADPAFGAASDGVATADTITPVAADASGLASFARVYDSDDNPVFDVAVGEGLTLASNSVVDGENVEVVSLTVSTHGVAQVARLLTSRDSFS